jgi:aspartyl-tRNA synthetase
MLSDLDALNRSGTLPMLRMRDRIRIAIRGLLADLEFLEVDTPSLGSHIAEYAAGHFRVTSESGEDLWLAQSPQVYKQALIAAGLPAYYQFAHCFRDEKIERGRLDLLREFIQVDVELRADALDTVMAVAERVVRSVCAAVDRPLLEGPFQTMTFAQAMDAYGTDKPDLRERPEDMSCLWVVDYPMARQQSDGTVALERHPMALPRRVPTTTADLLETTSYSFDLVINGFEVASGDLRIADSDTQAAVLDATGMPREGFEHLLHILRSCPPHGGFGLGLDRLTMVLVGSDSVAGATAFPLGFGAII